MDTSYYKKYEPIFGKWHIVRELGEGSFGKVFEIEHRDLSGTYSSALKVITIPRNKTELAQVAAENTGPDGVTKYFRSIVDGITKEFNIMSQLKGESTIVSYEDHEVREHTDGIGWDIFIRMELLTPLLQYTANYPLSRNDIIRLGIDICSALELCRKNAIIHRDIKPENIFVSKNGRFKLGDFGIAKNIDKTTSELTYAKLSSHDFTYFKNPENMITGKIGVPLFTVRNEKIILRHIFAVALSDFFAKQVDVYNSNNADVLLSGDGWERFCAYLSSKPEHLKDVLKASIGKLHILLSATTLRA